MSQSIKVIDSIPIETIIPHNLTDSNFYIYGEVKGLDSGNLNLYTFNKKFKKNLQIVNSKFFMSGINNGAPERLYFMISGDYYLHSFYLESGVVKLKYDYETKVLSATGTKENEFRNYITDTVVSNIDNELIALNNKIRIANESEDLIEYLRLTDSHKFLTKKRLGIADSLIGKKILGLYILDLILAYSGGYQNLDERKSMIQRLPDYLKYSNEGIEADSLLNKLIVKRNNINTGNAYSFKLKNLNNRYIDLKKYKGKIIVLDFWASWCKPCIAALPLLKQVQLNPIAKGVTFISISVDKKINDWKAKEKLVNLPWVSLLADSTTTSKYNVTAIPAYIIINKNGTIVSKSSSISELYINLQRLNTKKPKKI